MALDQTTTLQCHAVERGTEHDPSTQPKTTTGEGDLLELWTVRLVPWGLLP